MRNSRNPENRTYYPTARSRRGGFTVMETVIALAIVGILTGVFIITMAGSRATDKVDRGIQIVQNDLTYIRSRAVSTNQNHRLHFTSTTDWRLEMCSPGTDCTAPEHWSQVEGARQMPADTYLTSETFTNAGANLEATSRGLFDFKNGATGEPYITVTGLGVTRTKSLHVAVGGAVESEYD